VDQIRLDVMAILSALAETGGESPKVLLYLALDHSITRYERAEFVLLRGGLARAFGGKIYLTDLGREAGENLNAALQEGL